MSRIQQKRTGIRSTRTRIEAHSFKTALNLALTNMGISRPRWGSPPKTQDNKTQDTRRGDEAKSLGSVGSATDN